MDCVKSVRVMGVFRGDQIKEPDRYRKKFSTMLLEPRRNIVVFCTSREVLWVSWNSHLQSWPDNGISILGMEWLLESSVRYESIRPTHRIENEWNKLLVDHRKRSSVLKHFLLFFVNEKFWFCSLLTPLMPFCSKTCRNPLHFFYQFCHHRPTLPVVPTSLSLTILQPPFWAFLQPVPSNSLRLSPYHTLSSVMCRSR